MNFFVKFFGALKISLIKSIIWVFSLVLLTKILANHNALMTVSADDQLWEYGIVSKSFNFEVLLGILVFTIWSLPLSILRRYTSITFSRYIFSVVLYHGFYFALYFLLKYGTGEHFQFRDPVPLYIYITLFLVEFIYKLFEDIISNKVPPIDTRNARMLLLSAFLRSLFLYCNIIIMWPYFVLPDSVTSLVDLSNPSLLQNLFSNLKTLFLIFLLFIPIVFITKFIYSYLVQKSNRELENYIVLLFILVYVTILSVIVFIFFPPYTSKELFCNFYLLTTFTELFFIHFINQKLNSQIE